MSFVGALLSSCCFDSVNSVSCIFPKLLKTASHLKSRCELSNGNNGVPAASNGRDYPQRKREMRSESQCLGKREIITGQVTERESSYGYGYGYVKDNSYG